MKNVRIELESKDAMALLEMLNDLLNNGSVMLSASRGYVGERVELLKRTISALALVTGPEGVDFVEEVNRQDREWLKAQDRGYFATSSDGVSHQGTGAYWAYKLEERDKKKEVE